MELTSLGLTAFACAALVVVRIAGRLMCWLVRGVIAIAFLAAVIFAGVVLRPELSALFARVMHSAAKTLSSVGWS